MVKFQNQLTLRKKLNNMKFVKIYVKNSNKFLIVSTKEVPGTENLTEGKQDRNIRKTVYQWQDDKGKSWGCQVLITGGQYNVKL